MNASWKYQNVPVQPVFSHQHQPYFTHGQPVLPFCAAPFPTSPHFAPSLPVWIHPSTMYSAWQPIVPSSPPPKISSFEELDALCEQRAQTASKLANVNGCFSFPPASNVPPLQLVQGQDYSPIKVDSHPFQPRGNTKSTNNFVETDPTPNKPQEKKLEESDVTENLFDKLPRPDHKEALHNYRSHFLKNFPYPNRGGKAKKYVSSGSRSRNKRWWEAALHRLPLKIIERLEEITHFQTEFFNEEEQTLASLFLIPCVLEAPPEQKSYQRVERGVIELTLNQDGFPQHFFLRSFGGKDQTYLEKHLGSHLDDYLDTQNEIKALFDEYEEKQKQARLPRLGNFYQGELTSYKEEDSSSDSYPLLKFVSEYGLTISVQESSHTP